MLSESIDANIAAIDAAFEDCGDLVKREFPVGGRGLRVCLFYIDMLAERTMLDFHVISSVMRRFDAAETFGVDAFETLKNDAVTTSDVSEKDNFDDIATALMAGDAALFVDGFPKALVIASRGYPNRGVQSAESEPVVQGSKEAFCEVFRINTMLIRRRVRDTALKVKQVQIGCRSKTDIALMYLDDVVRPDILRETEKRIEKIDIDGILDSSYVEQLICDDPRSPFPLAQATERPDKAASAILEGRIAIIVDNSPYVLLVPATLNTFFQSSEDYYQHWLYTSSLRVLRFAAGILAVALPGLYIALTVFHPNIMPTLMILKMAGARSEIPIPAAFEVLIMDIAFELLREAGTRLPKAAGSTIGIVGGLIVGQAAVEAGIVSPIVVIVTALTGIAAFAVPNVAMTTAFRVVKYLIIVFSAFFGLLGFWAASVLCVIHLASLRSLGIPYLFPFASGEVNEYSDYKDAMYRVPLGKMGKRPIFANPTRITRVKEKNDVLE